MKPSIPMLLSFLLPLTLAATSHADEPAAAAPQAAPAVAPAAPTAPAEPPPAASAPAPTTLVYAASPYPTGPLPPPPSPLLERRSEGLRVAGIVLIPLGSVLLLGSSLVAVGSAFGGAMVEDDNGMAVPARESNTGRVAVAFMGLGALTLTGGIIMTVVGGKKVPVRTTEALASKPTWTAEPLVGVGTAGVKIRF